MPDSVQVRVRMYRPGLGDCFLLTFSERSDPTRVLAQVLIDCGVDWNTSGGADRIREIAQDLLKETLRESGSELDVLVVTHEHWDHVSGFKQAKKLFDQLTIKNVWLAWTEDPNDEFAKSLKAEQALALKAIAYASQQLIGNRATGAAARRSLAALGQGTARVLSFSGVDRFAAGFSKSPDEAMDYVSSRKQDDDYCTPGGKPLTLSALPGVRFYVLAPPKDVDALNKMNPSDVNPETYELLGGRFDEHRSFFAALQAHSARENPANAPDLLSENEARRLRDYPFAVSTRLADDSSEARALFAATYYNDSEDWRRIDYDWMTPAANLALQYDNGLNNTSLVLAIELVDSQRVLLFAADAQVGSWLSWHDCSFTIEDDSGDEREVKVTELLARTVLYKVGHHGSHNATLEKEGLEQMTSPELVAMIPVDEDYADKIKGWTMPHPPLYTRINEKTRGRVLRADKEWPKPSSQCPPGLSKQDWQAFKGATTATALFIDYVL